MTKFRRVPKSFINCVFFYDREKKKKRKKNRGREKFQSKRDRDNFYSFPITFSRKITREIQSSRLFVYSSEIEGRRILHGQSKIRDIRSSVGEIWFLFKKFHFFFSFTKE